MESERAVSPLPRGEHPDEARRQSGVVPDPLQVSKDVYETMYALPGAQVASIATGIPPFESRQPFEYAIAGTNVNAGLVHVSSGGALVPATDLAAQVQRNIEEIRLLRTLVTALYEERATRTPQPATVNEENDEVRAAGAYLDGPVSLAETARFRDALAHYEAVVRESVANGGPSEEAFAKLYEDACADADHVQPPQ